MDERDFAELISVFLKGNEPDKNSDHKEKEESDAVKDTSSSPRGAGVRKNIVETLAERVKESQGIEGNEAEPVGKRKEPGGKKRPLVDQERQVEISATEDKEPAASKTEEPEETKREREEQLITEEESDRLLNKKEPEEIIALQQILHRFTSIDGVIAALLVTRDGFVVDYASNIEFDLDMVSAVIATGFNTLDKIGHELEQGALRLAILEYEQGPVAISPLIQDVALVVVASQWTTLGRIRWEIKKRSDELIANL
ncbi:MAG TPA: roadblock/LC7 domain-containing protein [Anaerolineae bacterium]|nr:roadblock/LC7 domain-containing protein [Anaerolineae bacterium]